MHMGTIPIFNIELHLVTDAQLLQRLIKWNKWLIQPYLSLLKQVPMTHFITYKVTPIINIDLVSVELLLRTCSTGYTGSNHMNAPWGEHTHNMHTWRHRGQKQFQETSCVLAPWLACAWFKKILNAININHLIELRNFKWTFY